MRGTILIIFFVVMALRGIMKKLAEAAAKQEPRQRREEDVVYEATPEEVGDFLRSLSAGPGPRAEAVQQAGPQRVAVGRGPMPAAPDFLAPAPVQRAAQPQEQVVLPWDRESPPAQPVERRRAALPRRREEPAPAPAPARPRKAKARKADRARKTKKVKVPAEAKRTAAVTPRSLRQFGLKQAIVWAEILGPPVSMRRSQRKPPSMRS